MADLRYEVSFKGVASADIRAAFGECEPDTGHGESPRCAARRRSFSAVLTRIEDLGLELLEVRLVARGAWRAGRERDGGDRAAARDLRLVDPVGVARRPERHRPARVPRRRVLARQPELGRRHRRRRELDRPRARRADPGAAALRRRVERAARGGPPGPPVTARLLGIGLPLSILAGTGVARAAVPQPARSPSPGSSPRASPPPTPRSARRSSPTSGFPPGYGGC